MTQTPFNLELHEEQLQDAYALLLGLHSIRNSLSSTRATAGIMAEQMARRGDNAAPGVGAVASDVSRAVSALDSWASALDEAILKAQQKQKR